MSKRVYSTSLSFCHFHAARPDFGDDAMVLSGLCLACASSRAEELDVRGSRIANCLVLEIGSNFGMLAPTYPGVQYPCHGRRSIGRPSWAIGIAFLHQTGLCLHRG